MKHEIADERGFRAIISLLGVADAEIQAVLPGFFRYHWPCSCEIVIDTARREWEACRLHGPRDLRNAASRTA